MPDELNSSACNLQTLSPPFSLKSQDAQTEVAADSIIKEDICQG